MMCAARDTIFNRITHLIYSRETRLTLSLRCRDYRPWRSARPKGHHWTMLPAVLAKLNLPIHETDVLVVLATVVGKLARQHVNLQCVTAGAPGGKTTGMLKVSNLANAEKMLKTTKKKSLTKRSTVKRQPSGRRR